MPTYMPKNTENICPHKNMYITVHRSIIQNNQNLKTTQMSMDKPNVVYPNNGILFSH